jgi:DNA-binding CsgD family transcriptional regulator
VGGAPEKRRRQPATADAELLNRRGTPAVFIVDEFLNVLSYYEDPRERRYDCRMPKTRSSLPPLIERTVVALLRRRLDGRSTEAPLTAAPNASIVVRMIPLTGSGATYAVLVERMRLRRHLHTLAQRFGLSAREREVLGLIAKGAKNSEIARTLNIAESTAIFHVKRLLAKTNSRNRTELVSKAVG